MNSVWNYSAHPQLKTLITKLEERFGDALEIIDSDPEWLTFKVQGLTAFNLIHLLERERISLFGPALGNLQIVAEQAGHESAVSIRYLADARAHSAVHQGFWYY